MDMHRKDHVRTQGGDDHLQAEAAGGISPVDTLILDFQPPGLGGNILLLFKQPGPWCFVMAAQAERSH